VVKTLLSLVPCLCSPLGRVAFLQDRRTPRRRRLDGSTLSPRTMSAGSAELATPPSRSFPRRLTLFYFLNRPAYAVLSPSSMRHQFVSPPLPQLWATSPTHIKHSPSFTSSEWPLTSHLAASSAQALIWQPAGRWSARSLCVHWSFRTLPPTDASNPGEARVFPLCSPMTVTVATFYLLINYGSHFVCSFQQDQSSAQGQDSRLLPSRNFLPSLWRRYKLRFFRSQH